MPQVEFSVPEDLSEYFSIKENVTEFVNRVQNITAVYNKTSRILYVKSDDQRALNKADMILELYFKDGRKKGPQKKKEDGQSEQKRQEAVVVEKITKIHLDNGDDLSQARKRLLEAETLLFNQRLRHEEEKHQLELKLIEEQIATEKIKQKKLDIRAKEALVRRCQSLGSEILRSSKASTLAREKQSESSLVEEFQKVHHGENEALVQARIRLLDAETAHIRQRMRHEEEKHKMEMEELQEIAHDRMVQKCCRARQSEIQPSKPRKYKLFR